MASSGGILSPGIYDLLYNWSSSTNYEYVGLLTSLSPVVELSVAGYFRQRVYTHRVIDDISFNEIISNWGSNYSPYSGPGDMNFDGFVDDIDFNFIISYFGQTLVNPITGAISSLNHVFFTSASVAWNDIVGVAIYNSSYSGATVQAVIPLSNTVSLGVGDRFTIPLGKLALGFSPGVI